jgi:hypothetical protein
MQQGVEDNGNSCDLFYTFIFKVPLLLTFELSSFRLFSETVLRNISNRTMRTGLDFKFAQFD